MEQDKDRGISLRIDGALLAEIEKFKGKKTLSEYIRNTLERDINWGRKLEEAARILSNVEYMTSQSLDSLGNKMRELEAESHVLYEILEKRITRFESKFDITLKDIQGGVEERLNNLEQCVKAMNKLFRAYVDLVMTDAAKAKLKKDDVL